MKKIFVFALFGLVVLPGTLAFAVEQTKVAVPTLMPQANNDIIQFNNLVVTSVSGTSAPAEIVVSRNLVLKPTAGSTGANVTSITGSSLETITTCTKFESGAANFGARVECPSPTPTPLPTPQPTPIPYSYRIQVNADTILMLRDRTAATLSDFKANDKINVFGYYNTDGTIRGLIVRNLSKPEEKQFVQLNNVEVVGISENLFTVVQRPNNACVVFNGEKKTDRPCPLGVSTADPANPSISFVRKYDVRYSARTIFLDRNRGTILPSNIAVGNKLNVYGATSNNQTQPIDAEIIRDLSIPYVPPSPSSLSGTVTQVMSDGSFIIQTEDGRTITVQNPIQAGAVVKLKGILDELKSVISQVTEITLRSGGVPKKNPVINEIVPNAGPAGTAVTLKGNNFTPSGNSVNFANVRNAITGLSSSDGKTLTFQIPATPCATGMYCAQVVIAAGTYPLSVTNENGTSNALTFAITASL